MLKQAVAEKLILFNPAETVEELTAEGKTVAILTPSEVKKMFTPKTETHVPLLEGPEEKREVKKELRKSAFARKLAEVANMTAAVTGMRIGEVLGLKGSCIFETYIEVAGQFDKQRNYRQTKTKKVRQIPTTPVLLEKLHQLKALNGDGFLFSDNGGARPVSRYMFNKALASGLSKIGIDETEKKQRNLTPHAWRHFFNTTLRTNNVTDAKTQAIIGHTTQRMSDHYTEFDTRTFTEVREIQDQILLKDDAIKGHEGAGTGTEAGAGAGDREKEKARRPGRSRGFTGAGRSEANMLIRRKRRRQS
jgi:integrase